MENQNPIQPPMPVVPQNPIQEPTPSVIKTPQPIIPPAPEPVIQTPSEPSFEPKPKLSKWIMVAVVILVLIIVGGTTAYFLNKNSISKTQTPVTQTVVKPTPASNAAPADPTANWKTYTNDEHGFTFKYPRDWEYQIQKNAFSVLRDGLSEVEINFGKYEDIDVTRKKIDPIIGPAWVVLNIITYPSEVSSDLKSYAYNLNADEKTRWSEIKINGIPAQKVEHMLCQSGNCGDVLIVKGNIILDFFVQNGDRDLNTILSTFKFTDQTPTPTCRPRPACLDATPRCLIPETSDMCPKANQEPVVRSGCKVGGCSGELCQNASDEPLASICIYKESYACYKTARCEKQQNGICGWTSTSELTSCLGNSN